MWKLKAKEIAMITEALGIVIPKLEKWLQQIPGTSEIILFK